MNELAADPEGTATGPIERYGDYVSPPTRKPSGRALGVLLFLALTAFVIVGAWLVRYEQHGRYLEETNDATVQADMVSVAPKVAGYVTQLFVAENSDVAAGQMLVRIDPRDARATAAEAEARIGVAAAQEDAARTRIGEQYAVIKQARAHLAAAQAKAAYDAREAARIRPLVTAGAETPQLLAQLELAALQSRAEAIAKAAELEMQRRRIASFLNQVRQSQAQGREARAQLSSAGLNVGATELRASIAGRVGDKTVTVGQYVQAGMRLMSIVPLGSLYVTANFKETQLALMRPGQPAWIKVDALGGAKLRGRLESLAPGTGAQFSILPPQNATGNFTKVTQRVPVRVSIAATPAERRLLVPGLSVTVTVDTIPAEGDTKRLPARQEAADHADGAR